MPGSAMSHTPAQSDPDHEMPKRKRDADDSGPRQGHQRHRSTASAQGRGSISSSFASGMINYFPQQNAPRIGLIPGDADTFSGIIGLITEYEAVLDRHESLAANLGAKLTGPRILKGIDKFFDGPIKTNSPLPFADAISWLDVVAFAKANPQDFALTAYPNGSRCCQFTCKGLQVEITEDDWRLISSGALDRFPLEHPFEEDETAELATLDILEQRAAVLYKKADEVAARARILHHKFGHRKHDIGQRRQVHEGSGTRFQPLNQQRQSGMGPPYDLHADLLQQFIAASAVPQSRSTSGAGVSVTSAGIVSPTVAMHQHRLSSQSARSTGQAQPEATTAADAPVDVFRSLITQKTDRLLRGDTITPPCDRCRRLRLQCVKHLTACQGCTKKHAKCSWKAVTEEEAARLRQEMGVAVESEPVSAGTEGESVVRSSHFSRIVEEVTSLPSAIELEPRPRSSGDFATMGMYSPKTLPGTRFESEPDARRTSLPYGPVSGPGPIQLETPGQPRTMSQVASVATISEGAGMDYGQTFGGILNPSGP